MELQKTKFQIISFFKRNWLYKIISLIISILLWLILMSQKDLEMVIDFEIQPQLGERSISFEIKPSKVSVHLAGSKEGLRKVISNSWNKIIILDLSDYSPGVHQILIYPNQLNLPKEVKVLNINPKLINVLLKLNP